MVESGVLAALSIFLHFGMGGASQVTAVIKNPPANAGDTGNAGLTLGQENPLEEDMAPTLVFLPGKLHGHRNLAGYNP